MKRFAVALSLAVLFAAAPFLLAQTNPTVVHDSAPLKPPPGARVAIVEFYDMECPMCRQVNPLLVEAQKKYNIPWVRHDFPLKIHNWSFQAAVDARWFDTKSKELGNQFRDEVFANQPNIATKSDLRAFAEKFAQQHGIGFPFLVDPQGKLAAEVNADYSLGERVGIQHTPTVWIVTDKTNGTPYTEVTDFNQLFQIIDQALAETHAEANTGHHARHAGSR